MACETELGNTLAALPALAVCATAETGIGAAACAAALWTYYQQAQALNQCLARHGIAGIDAHLNAVYAEAQYVQSVAESAGQSAQA